MTAQYQFKRECSFMGEIDFVVFGDGTPYGLTLRHMLGDYERSILNGGEEYAVRMVEPLIGRVRNRHDPLKPVPAAVLAAFNAWRLAEWEGFMTVLKAHPEKYGEWDEIAGDFPTPAPVASAYLKPDLSAWILES
jgi:hypothetical protein